MNSEMTKFSDAIYHKKDRYDFAETIFTRRELKILALVDGEKSVSDISTSLSTDISTLMGDFIKLVQLGLIQTEGGIVSSGAADLIFNDSPIIPSEYSLTRLPSTAAA
jgi:predicted transcriptional regulator